MIRTIARTPLGRQIYKRVIDVVDVLALLPPSRLLLGLRADHWPLEVIRHRGRSNWPPDKPIKFVTSFNFPMYEGTGRRCIETFRANNPTYELVAFVEATQPDQLRQMREGIASIGCSSVNLAEVPLLEQFFQVARDLIPRQYGGDAPDELFNDLAVYFRKNMIRWFRKIVALDHSSQNYDGALVWMDCDCYSMRPLPQSVLERAFGGAGVFYMKANRTMTEASLVGYDLAVEGTRELLADMKNHYLERRFASLHNWDDCTTLDHVRSKRSTPVCRDIGIWADRDGHIVRSSILGPYVEHDKGAHGRFGTRPVYETTRTR
jgi:hypothetical protein